MILSADGLRAVVSQSELRQWGIQYIYRSGGRCGCGGPDAEGRAVKAMAQADPFAGTLPTTICTHGHEGYAVVLTKDLPVQQGTFTMGHLQWDLPKPPAKKAIPDWPLSCPRCQRTASAVLLFMGYDCKHGCFK